MQALRQELRKAGLSEAQAEKFLVSLRASRGGSAAHGLSEFWAFCEDLSIDSKQVRFHGTSQLAVHAITLAPSLSYYHMQLQRANCSIAPDTSAHTA